MRKKELMRHIALITIAVSSSQAMASYETEGHYCFFNEAQSVVEQPSRISLLSNGKAMVQTHTQYVSQEGFPTILNTPSQVDPESLLIETKWPIGRPLSVTHELITFNSSDADNGLISGLFPVDKSDCDIGIDKHLLASLKNFSFKPWHLNFASGNEYAVVKFEGIQSDGSIKVSSGERRGAFSRKAIRPTSKFVVDYGELDNKAVLQKDDNIRISYLTNGFSEKVSYTGLVYGGKEPLMEINSNLIVRNDTDRDFDDVELSYLIGEVTTGPSQNMPVMMARASSESVDAYGKFDHSSPTSLMSDQIEMKLNRKVDLPSHKTVSLALTDTISVPFNKVYSFKFNRPYTKTNIHPEIEYRIDSDYLVDVVDNLPSGDIYLYESNHSGKKRHIGKSRVNLTLSGMDLNIRASNATEILIDINSEVHTRNSVKSSNYKSVDIRNNTGEKKLIELKFSDYDVYRYNGVEYTSLCEKEGDTYALSKGISVESSSGVKINTIKYDQDISACVFGLEVNKGNFEEAIKFKRKEI